MNPADPGEDQVQDAPPVSLIQEAEGLIRKQPLAAVLTALGVGCAIGFAARELLAAAPAPRNRALGLLEDIQERLTEFLEPAGERVSHFAEEGSRAVKDGLHAVVDSKLGHRLRDLFS